MGFSRKMEMEKVGNTHFDSNIDLHSITPHSTLQFAAHACDLIRPRIVIVFRRGHHLRCPVQSQPSVAIGKRLEL